jgi:magnesium-dependent phosphatase-1
VCVCVRVCVCLANFLFSCFLRRNVDICLATMFKTIIIDVFVCFLKILISRHALDYIQRMQNEGYPIRVAVASKTDEPEWAYICMQHMCLTDGITSLLEFFGKNKETIEISYGSKSNHIRRLHKTTGIPYIEMAFFDNEHSNIKDIQTNLPEVKCYYTPNGMTREAWQQALKDFQIDS